MINVVKKYVLSAVPAPTPIVEPVSKLGGQPVWLAEPKWPLSKATGKPMSFVGQFALYPEIFGSFEAQMAYIFMYDDEPFVDGTWLPNGGENAVILQPGAWNGPTMASATGPTLYDTVQRPDGVVEQVPVEYGLRLTLGEDADVLDENAFRARDAWDEYCAYLDESKIGGAPAFLQNPEYPGPGSWRLLAQLNGDLFDYNINFGDAGVGYAFIDDDGVAAKFLWQCL
ncbi:MAG TPA: DUF1963 domain-containing protein [Ktedonobacterales bacterium]|jgi:hypothetical protein